MEAGGVSVLLGVLKTKKTVSAPPLPLDRSRSSTALAAYLAEPDHIHPSLGPLSVTKGSDFVGVWRCTRPRGGGACECVWLAGIAHRMRGRCPCPDCAAAAAAVVRSSALAAHGSVLLGVLRVSRGEAAPPLPLDLSRSSSALAAYLAEPDHIHPSLGPLSVTEGSGCVGVWRCTARRGGRACECVWTAVIAHRMCGNCGCPDCAAAAAAVVRSSALAAHGSVLLGVLRVSRGEAVPPLPADLSRSSSALAAYLAEPDHIHPSLGPLSVTEGSGFVGVWRCTARRGGRACECVWTAVIVHRMRGRCPCPDCAAAAAVVRSSALAAHGSVLLGVLRVSRGEAAPPLPADLSRSSSALAAYLAEPDHIHPSLGPLSVTEGSDFAGVWRCTAWRGGRACECVWTAVIVRRMCGNCGCPDCAAAAAAAAAAEADAAADAEAKQARQDRRAADRAWVEGAAARAATAREEEARLSEEMLQRHRAQGITPMQLGEVQLWREVEVEGGRRTSTHGGIGLGLAHFHDPSDGCVVPPSEIALFGLAIEGAFDVGRLGGCDVHLKAGNRRAVACSPQGPRPFSESARRDLPATLVYIEQVCTRARVPARAVRAVLAATRALAEVDRAAELVFLSSGEARDAVRPTSASHHDARGDQKWYGPGNSPHFNKFQGAKAGHRLVRLIISLSPNLRMVNTMLQQVDEKGEILPHQPTWQARLSACGIDLGERSEEAERGMAGYADFYLCAPGAGDRIRNGSSTHANEMVWRAWRGACSVVALSPDGASSGCEHGGSSQVPMTAVEQHERGEILRVERGSGSVVAMTTGSAAEHGVPRSPKRALLVRLLLLEALGRATLVPAAGPSAVEEGVDRIWILVALANEYKWLPVSFCPVSMILALLA
ncbi:hypothetical protein EMIHUDRAFT_113908 [Emiliania huxleyi CCMP1516]|uniref:Uncharacterized protein n=2 Tax=Emiliania huxleyi TaxID=2903 RepID=A0A0D3JZT9_EMIH1|nr:hypothetical protein EMIHUDRAFT_113908 [Emiliania huxleyi CCMP1516]EOD29024.1 hypothetical protein EMIHUDRAFT_113908 [Emiliania huxleyi CCMP1516]|eukprot:XP_005781453.1 hypothetical protein EMIHUDRAFT_113908 [Emiliania huxleyi CCMP1516]